MGRGVGRTLKTRAKEAPMSRPSPRSPGLNHCRLLCIGPVLPWVTHVVSVYLLTLIWFPGLGTVLAAEWVSAALSALGLGAALWAVHAVIGALAAAVMRGLWPREGSTRDPRRAP